MRGDFDVTCSVIATRSAETSSADHWRSNALFGRGVRDYIPNGCSGPDLPATITEVRAFQSWYGLATRLSPPGRMATCGARTSATTAATWTHPVVATCPRSLDRHGESVDMPQSVRLNDPTAIDRPKPKAAHYPTSTSPPKESTTRLRGTRLRPGAGWVVEPLRRLERVACTPQASRAARGIISAPRAEGLERG
jgi:hypothetical protein